MAPEEIVQHIDSANRQLLYAEQDYLQLTPEQILVLMNAAALQGFRYGSDMALSRLQGELFLYTLTGKGPKERSSS